MSWKICPWQQFAVHASAWDALQGACTPTPFLESAFVLPLLEVFADGRELLALHYKQGQLDAATLVRPVGGGRWETFQPSQLPLGAWISAAQADVGALAAELLSALPGLALSLGLTQLDPKLNPRPAANNCMRLQEYVKTSFVDVNGSFETYWEARGKNLRQNTRKQRNKLLSDGTTTRIDSLCKPEDIAPALLQYGALESAGWKAAGGTAIDAGNSQGSFYGRMLVNFCRQGRGRVVRYWFNDRVVAMDLCIDNGPMVVILKTAYDETLKQLSPSVLMRHDEFKSWWEEGRFKRIEFYGKTMEWHTRWTSDERALYHATVYRWPWVAKARELVVSWRKPAAPPDTSAAPAAPVASTA